MTNTFHRLNFLLCATWSVGTLLCGEGFVLQTAVPVLSPQRIHQPKVVSFSAGPLFAKKTKKTKARSSVGGTGFGGAGADICSCGSGLAYNKCCGILHRDPKLYSGAKAEQVVRARYTAYAKRVVDFIIASTHPLNKNFVEDIQHWRDTIEANCYDNFELTKCSILDESYNGKGSGVERATVRFQANMMHRETREITAFMETSTFERDPGSGAWLYLDGVVEPVETSDEEHVGVETT